MTDRSARKRLPYATWDKTPALTNMLCWWGMWRSALYATENSGDDPDEAMSLEITVP